MRNRDLHDALREFALETAAFLTDEVRAGAELEFDVIDGGHGSGPALYRYQPRTAAFLDARWEELRALPACRRAAEELGAGAAPWLRVNGMRGEQAEPALRAMIDRLYEDATSFGFPEERFERLYEEVESTLFRDAVSARVVAPLAGVQIESDTVDLGRGLSLGVGDCVDAPAEAVWPEGSESDEPAVLCVVERDVQADDHIPASEAEERFRGLVTALRLWAPGAIALCAPGWRRSGEGRWGAVGVGGPGTTRGEPWTLAADEEDDLREFLTALGDTPAGGPVGWALGRFEMGCERAHDAEALSDYLLGLRALLDATSDAGEASLALRVAALCAEEGERRAVQRRIEAALALERLPHGRPRQPSGADRVGVAARARARDGGTPARAAARRALRLPRARPEGRGRRHPARDRARAVRARRGAPRSAWRCDACATCARRTGDDQSSSRSRSEPVAAAPVQHKLEGVTQSADWGWDDPEDYSAPV